MAVLTARIFWSVGPGARPCPGGLHAGRATPAAAPHRHPASCRLTPILSRTAPACASNRPLGCLRARGRYETRWKRRGVAADAPARRCAPDAPRCALRGGLHGVAVWRGWGFARRPEKGKGRPPRALEGCCSICDAPRLRGHYRPPVTSRLGRLSSQRPGAMPAPKERDQKERRLHG